MRTGLAAGIGLLLASCAGSPAAPGIGPRPEVLGHSNVVPVDQNGNGAQVLAFLAAHRAKRTAGLCGVTITSDEFDAYEASTCIVTQHGEAQVSRRLDEDRYWISPLRYLGRNRFELLGTVGQQVVLEPWPPD